MATPSNSSRADALIRFSRSSFYYAALISILPRVAFRIGEWILGGRYFHWVDITALSVFFMILVFVAWKARSVLDYVVAVATSAVVHALFFFEAGIRYAKRLEHDEFNAIDYSLSDFLMQLAMLALVVAVLSLPVYLVRRMRV